MAGARGEETTNNYTNIHSVLENQHAEKITGGDYTICHNDNDYFTMDKWDDDVDILYLQFYGVWHCYDFEMLKQFWAYDASVMAEWEGGDEMGYRGRPNDYLVIKVPPSFWISFDAYETILSYPERSYKMKVVIENLPIGNLRGQMGVSMLHGQSPQTIFGIDE
jgi:hypothetical protein